MDVPCTTRDLQQSYSNDCKETVTSQQCLIKKGKNINNSSRSNSAQRVTQGKIDQFYSARSYRVMKCEFPDEKSSK